VRLIEEIEAPCDGAAERPLPFRERSWPGREDGQPRLEPRQDLLRRQDLGAGSGQLDGQGQPVQPRGDLGHRPGILFGHPEPRAHRKGSLSEELHRLEPAQLEDAGEPREIGRLEGRDHELLLAADREDDPGGNQRGQSRCRREQLLDDRSRRHHLFEVVEDQEHLLVAEVFGEDLEERSIRHLSHPQRPRHGRWDQRWVHHRGEVHEVRTVAEVRERSIRHLKGEASLARAAGAGEGQQARSTQQPSDLGDLPIAPHERGELGGEVVRPRVDGPGRREIGREPFDHDVVEVRGLGDVLQAMRAEIAQR
jgi:hypothetical protein